MGGPVRDREVFDHLLATLLEGCGSDLLEASMVLPDSWLRTVPIEADCSAEDDEDVLRWRLKKLVPFNVEALRVRAIEGPDGTVLLGFVVDRMVSDLEEAFAARGIRLGFIANRSLCIAAALQPRDELQGVLLLADDGYSLVVARPPETVLMRYKNLDPFDLDEGLQSLVRRDLVGTRSLLERDPQADRLARCLVCGPDDSSELWLALVEESLEAPTQPLTVADLRAYDGDAGQPWHVLAPMLGLAATEVA